MFFEDKKCESNLKIRSTEELRSHCTVVGGTSETQFSDDQLFGVAAMDSKLHNLCFIDRHESSTSSFWTFLLHQRLSLGSS